MLFSNNFLKKHRLLKNDLLILERIFCSCNVSYQTSKHKWPTDKIRNSFIDYFCKSNKHKFIQSSSVLPRRGSGTYFTNAGMNQFKSIIQGELLAESIIDFSKYIGVANYQKCIRIGGKHSDLEDIGKDTYHHTFFESNYFNLVVNR
jgi:alanyl-tRNA synthetase